MPAAAVIPAPIAYIKVVAVKKLVVGCLSSAGRRRSESRVRARSGRGVSKPPSLRGRTTPPEWWFGGPGPRTGRRSRWPSSNPVGRHP